MTTIEQIRAEIERRKKALHSTLFNDEYNDLLSFLDTLQEPKVDLEKEVEKYFQGLWPGMETAEQCNTDMHFTPPAIMRLARHFANWQKSKMPMPEDTVIFQKGIEEGKRLMLEDAVEGYVNYYEDGGGKLMAEAQVGCPYHIGDKVKIIIVPIKED